MKPAAGWLYLLCSGPLGAAGPLALNLQNIEVRTALLALAEHAGRDMVIGDAVSGRISLRLARTDWEQALELILLARGLEKRQIGNTLFIARREDLLADERQRHDAARQRLLLQPPQLRPLVLHHRQASDLKKRLEAARVLSERGALLADEASNRLFVLDIPENLARIETLLAQIDQPARQVQIEARIVEASDHFSRELGARLAFARRSPGGAPAWQARVDLPVTRPFGTIDVLFRPGTAALIDLELQAMQVENHGKVISSPRLITADRTLASIEEGSEIPYPLANRRGGRTTAFKKATLSLRVRPQIAADGQSIWLDIEISKDSPNYRQSVGDTPTVDTKRLRTRVQVEHGGTVVLGGIYIDESGRIEHKIPGLGDLPLIGALFRQTQTRHGRRELLVFLTPHIIHF